MTPPLPPLLRKVCDAAPTDLAVVFDLDGTLIASAEFDALLYVEAVRDVLGAVPIDETWQRYRHVSDAGILAEIVAELGLPEPGRVAARVRAAFGAKVRRYLGSGAPCSAVAGAAAAVERLRVIGCKVGIATGGWAHTARMKLASACFPHADLVLASSDDAFDRVDIMSACLERLGGTPSRAIYFGDGPWDADATRRAGWAGFVGVGPKVRGLCEHWIADFDGLSGA